MRRLSIHGFGPYGLLGTAGSEDAANKDDKAQQPIQACKDAPVLLVHVMAPVGKMAITYTNRTPPLLLQHSLLSVGDLQKLIAMVGNKSLPYRV